VLSLTAVGGTATGSVTLNGENLTSALFKKHCSLVTQDDHHWAFLTGRETLTYAAQLYQVSLTPAEIKAKVDAMLRDTGLESAADTRVGSALVKGMSGGQMRRLSVAVALLKRLDVICLDEPTSGLDSASAASVMQFLAAVTRQHSLITLITVHQPSTAVYNGFDRVMILTKGMVAYSGKAGQEALAYFSEIGHPIGKNTNPAEFMVDLVNGDFNEMAVVDGVLAAWAQRTETPALPPALVPALLGLAPSEYKGDIEAQGEGEGEEGEELPRCALGRQVVVLLDRHFTLAIRDPMLYLGRMIIFLVATLFFAIIYVKARETTQDQVINRMWYIMWCIGMPANMGVIAVYAYNQEFLSIQREARIGMVMPSAYLIATTMLQIPVMLLFAIFGVTVGGYGVLAMELSHYGDILLVYALCMASFEAFAMVFSVASVNPLIGMLNFVQIWFAAFLFCGLMIPIDNVVWPFKLFGYIMPLKYCLRILLYNEFIDQDWKGAELCDPQSDANCFSVSDKQGPTDGWTCGSLSEACYGKEGWQVIFVIIFSF
jgi:ABC-type multidrug transport system ATPase subunit